MWFHRHKTAVPEANSEALPPVAATMRRIEITVERHSVTRFSRSNGDGRAAARAACASRWIRLWQFSGVRCSRKGHRQTEEFDPKSLNPK